MHPVVSAPPSLTRREMNSIFDDYLSHLVLKEVRSTIIESSWSYVDKYVNQFFRVSHMYMVQAAPGDQSSPTHQDILEEEQAQLVHAHDVLPRCCHIMEIA